MAQAQRGRTHRHPLSQMASVAIANAGQLRVMLHPLVVQSFALMRNGLAHDGHRVTTFVALGNVSDTKLAEVRATYGAAVVVNVPGMLACNVRCELPCDTRKTGVFQWLDQYRKVRAAFRQIELHEKTLGKRFDWLLRLRPDLIYFAPFPPLSPFDKSFVYVPRGIMTSAPQLQAYNDHAFLCHRASCRAYFNTVGVYEQCESNTSGWLRALRPDVHQVPQVLFQRPYAGRVQLFNLSYTLARHNGPECGRMECVPRSAGATGCVAPNLPEQVGRCRHALAEWSAASRAAASRDSLRSPGDILDTLGLGGGLWKAFGRRLGQRAARPPPPRAHEYPHLRDLTCALDRWPLIRRGAQRAWPTATFTAANGRSRNSMALLSRVEEGERTRCESKTVLVTAADADHYESLLCFLVSLSALPRPPCAVSVYDLGGLNASTELVAGLQAACRGVSLRRLDWLHLPAFTRPSPNGEDTSTHSARNESAIKGHYAWKPAALAAELARAPSGACVVYADAEVWLESRIPERLCALAVEGGGFASPASAGTNRQWTHWRMLDYFDAYFGAGFDARAALGRAPAAGATSAAAPGRAAHQETSPCDGGLLAMVQGSAVVEYLMSAWLACSTRVDCIAPRGSTRRNHRQDQAALSIVVHDLVRRAGERGCGGYCSAQKTKFFGPSMPKNFRRKCSHARRTRPGQSHRFVVQALANATAASFEATVDGLKDALKLNATADSSRPSVGGVPRRAFSVARVASAVGATSIFRIWAPRVRSLPPPAVAPAILTSMERNARAKLEERAAWLSSEHMEGAAFRDMPASKMWSLFQPYWPCVWTLEKQPSVSVRHDGGKWLCGVRELGDALRGMPKKKCVVYSFGSENKFHFEKQVRFACPLRDPYLLAPSHAFSRLPTPSHAFSQVRSHAPCEIHTFDPTVIPAFSPYYSHFHSLGLGGARAYVPSVGPVWPLADILAVLRHSELEILKIDVEGSEFSALSAIDWTTLPCRVGQILLEVHPCRAYGRPPCHGVVAVQRMFTQLEAAGFRLFSLEPVSKTDYSQVEVSWIHKNWSPSGWQ